jgi:hypothetical protein
MILNQTIKLSIYTHVAKPGALINRKKHTNHKQQLADINSFMK